MHQYGMWMVFFSMQNPSFYSYYSPNDRPNILLLRLKHLGGISSGIHFHHWIIMGIQCGAVLINQSLMMRGAGLRQVREEEGIPDLEEETEQEDVDTRRHIMPEERVRNADNHAREEVKS
ncbi:hypothetical protein Ancab_027798 [Ancistrocladus abbreviatus]